MESSHLFGTIEETFAVEAQRQINVSAFHLLTGLLVPARLRAETAKRPKSLPAAATKWGNWMPRLRCNQFHLCLTVQALDVYGLCRPYRVATAGALILAGAGLSHSSAQVSAVAIMCAGSRHTDAVTLVAVNLNVNQVSGQQPLQQPVTGFCDAVPVCRVLPDNQTMLLGHLLEQTVMVKT